MAYDVVRAQGVLRDLELIFDYLLATYENLGDTPEEAFDRAERRILSIDETMNRLGAVPFQGTLCPELGEGLRRVSKDKVVYYFDVDETQERLRVLAVFFGGQDHQRHMLMKMLAWGKTNQG